LIISQFGKLAGPNDATMKPEEVAHLLEKTADAQPCPTELPTGYDAFVGVDDEQPQTCEGGPKDNSWYGKGQVNALSAVSP
jgi:hypothetical protein